MQQCNESISDINALKRVQQFPYLVAMVYNESALHSMSCIVLAGAIFSFLAGVTFELGARSQALVALVSTRYIAWSALIVAVQLGCPCSSATSLSVISMH